MALTQVPGSLISPDSALPTGAGPVPYIGTAAPAGWVLASGRTIGSAASAATERANADCQALFTLLWNSFADAQAAVSGGRGASAAADWAANKTIALPDLRGRVVAGKDDMGGSAAGRMTSGGAGVNGTVMGASGGAQTHTLTTNEMPLHGHPTQVSSNSGSASTPTGGMMLTTNSSASRTAHSGAAGNSVGEQVGGAGGGGAHANLQPTLVVNAIIKL